MSTKQIQLCIIGNMMGQNAGHVTSQGQIIADLFIKGGYKVVTASSHINRGRRLTDIIQTILKNRNHIDVLILEVYSGLSMVIADTVSLLCKLLKIPLIAVLHGGNLPTFTQNHTFWVTRVLKRAKVLIAPSAFLATEMEEFGFQACVIPNVLKLDIYPYKKRNRIAPNLIWMRSFHSVYNPEMALKVFFSLRAKEPTSTLVMAGSDKGLETEIKEMANRMGLQDSVRFPGLLNESAKIKEFSKADIYLNTNKIDNMPVTVVEACAMGLPIIATNVGGIPYIISDRENGLLVPDADVSSMTNAVITLLDDPKLVEKLSINGRKFAEQSSWDSVQLKWDKVISDALIR